MKKKKALFLDRDGTLIVDKHYLCEPSEVELIPGVVNFIDKALALGFELFLLTNQSGINRGYCTWAQVHACNTRMLELLNLPMPIFKKICIAPETPQEPSVYRKPSPLFIEEMVAEYCLDRSLTWMIGDKLCDLQAAINASVLPAWAQFSANPPAQELKDFLKTYAVPTLRSLDNFWQVCFKAS